MFEQLLFAFGHCSVDYESQKQWYGDTLVFTAISMLKMLWIKNVIKALKQNGRQLLLAFYLWNSAHLKG